MKKLLIKISTVLMVAVLCIAMTGCSLFESGSGDINNLPDSNVQSGDIVFNTQEESGRHILSRPEAVDMVKRSVVAIEIKRTIDMRVLTSSGSGVIVDAAGLAEGEHYIITCHHVIASGGDMTVYIPDENARNIFDDDYNEEYALRGSISAKKDNNSEVTLVGGDKECDIAVLKFGTKGKNLDIVSAKVPVADYTLRQGEDVFSVGNPSGTLPMSVAAGCVSYLGREAYFDEVGYMNLIQIDVPINHGSSGGGLFNMYGELVGITNGGSDKYNSLNYSIPFYGDNGFINIAKQLIATETETNFGFVTGRWQMGINIVENSDFGGALAVKISTVVRGSDAERAGLKAGDIVDAIEFKIGSKNHKLEDIKNTQEFKIAVAKLKKYISLGDEFTMIVKRGALPVRANIKLTKQFIFCDTGYYPEV